MHPQIKRQVFGSGQRHTGSGDTLNRRVVGQIGKQHGTVNGAGAPEFIDEKL